MGGEINQELGKILARWDSSKYHRYKAQWSIHLHDVFNEQKRPNDKVRVIEEYVQGGAIVERDRITERPVNRIPFGIEQDIVGIHTSFSVGQDPDLRANPINEDEKRMLDMIMATEKANKVRHHNKRIVRSWLSEAFVAEYWYAVEDKQFYRNMEYATTHRLKCAIWSPFRGDQLIPIKDNTGDLVSFYRSYSVKVGHKDVRKIMKIDKSQIIVYVQSNGGWVEEEQYSHGFDKIPVIYMERDEPLTSCISSIRNRLETLASNFADCIDYNFAPKLLATGGVTGVKQAGKTQVVELENGGDLRYLTWQQSPEAVHLEQERLIDMAYQLTNTPRISLKDMQGAGNGFSGESFKYVFMGAHMAVRNHEETIGEFLQRRYNFMVHAISLIVPSLSKGATLEIDPILTPFTIGGGSVQEQHG